MRVPDVGAIFKPKFKGVSLPPLALKVSPNRSKRNGKVDLFVVHDTEGGYEGSVSWLCNPKAEASAHVILSEDGSEATQIVPWESKAWACAAFNGRSENLELAGFASKPYKESQLRVAARITAFRLTKRGLKPRHVNPSKGQYGGFCYHSDLGVPGGGHHDPGFSPAQRKFFEACVKAEFKRGGFRPYWGPEV